MPRGRYAEFPTRLGPEPQRRAVAEEAERRGWNVRWIEDAGYTGRSDRRPGLQRHRAPKRKEARALVVAKLDRLSRSVQHFARFLDLAQRQRCALVELSHGLLHHPPTPALDNRGCREWNQDIEDEAQWLAEILLVTEDAALAIARRRQPLVVAANRFQVSEQMIQFRLNMTGAQRRVDRVRRSRVGPNGSEHKEPSKVLRRWAGVSIAAVVRVMVVG